MIPEIRMSINREEIFVLKSEDKTRAFHIVARPQVFSIPLTDMSSTHGERSVSETSPH
jgi:hypothetical protein